MTEEQKAPEAEEAPKKAAPKKSAGGIKNVSRFRFKVYGKIVQPGATYEPTSADKKDEKATKRIDNAVRKGYLDRV